ncbi:MAG TPA: NAD-dependent epimerase/dehydratase family protein, partial [Candidatus Omnitrophota bacterium]|nr:NAD-dependent epimerase/dehydratase family protein [Candidatus Omnitrophota bacterium]
MIRKFHLAKLLERKDFDAVRIDLGRKGNPSGKSAVSMSDKDIIKVLKNNGITAHAVKLWGSGRPKREFLHVEDMVDACMFLMQRAELGNAGECINIGCGKDLSIKELACMVRDIVGYEGKISWDRSKPDGTPRKLLNVSKITKMGWRPAIELADGIRKTYEMYLRK